MLRRQLSWLICVGVLSLTGCLSAQKQGPKPLGQPLNADNGRGVGSPSDSQSAVELLKERNKKSDGGWFAWTQPISNGFQKLTSPLLTRRSADGQPRDQLSLDFEVKPNADLYMGTAQYAANLGKLDEARSMYEKALEQEPRPDIKISLARVAVRQKDFDYAEKLYQELLKENAESPVLHNDLGMLYDQMNDVERCYSHYRKAIALAPDSQRYRNNLATRMVNDGRLTEAKALLLEVVDPPTADLTLSALLQQAGQTALAAEYWKSASRQTVALGPEHPLHDYFRESATRMSAAQQPSAWNAVR